LNKPKALVIAILIAGIGYWSWGILFPSAEKQIKETLQRLAEVSSFGSNEKSLSRLGAINAVPRFFVTNAVVRIAGGFSRSLDGREEIREAVAGSRAVAQSLKIALTDPQVTIVGPREAKVLVTATVYVDSEPTPQLQILELTMEREKRKWLIKRIDPINLNDI
jgi:hypothetical protein